MKAATQEPMIVRIPAAIGNPVLYLSGGAVGVKANPVLQ
jgi:hypothetical protein